jgi:branched-chain amino acid transport system ATP-binding protein
VNAPLLELRDVVAGYGPLDALHGISLTVPAGAVTALLGANGAGKSTTLKVIAGQVPVRSGDVLLRGRRLAHAGSVHRRSSRGIVLVPEGRGVFPGLTVRENLAVFAGGRIGRGRIEEVTTHFPVLGRRLGQSAGSMSGGEQQMLALARALLVDPTVLLLDEISLGLAPLVVAELFETVAGLRRPDRAIVVVEQFVSYALGLADVAYRLERGVVEFAGDPGEMRAHLDVPA